jgi:hypothetical protein
MFWYNWSRSSDTLDQTDYGAPMLSTTQHNLVHVPLIALINTRYSLQPNAPPIALINIC